MVRSINRNRKKSECIWEPWLWKTAHEKKASLMLLVFFYFVSYMLFLAKEFTWKFNHFFSLSFFAQSLWIVFLFFINVFFLSLVQSFAFVYISIYMWLYVVRFISNWSTVHLRAIHKLFIWMLTENENKSKSKIKDDDSVNNNDCSEYQANQSIIHKNTAEKKSTHRAW